MLKNTEKSHTSSFIVCLKKKQHKNQHEQSSTVVLSMAMQKDVMVTAPE